MKPNKIIQGALALALGMAPVLPDRTVTNINVRVNR